MANRHRSRVVAKGIDALRRRPWGSALGGLAAAVLIAAAVALLVGNSGGGDFVQTRGRSTPRDSMPETSEPSSTTTAPTTTATPGAQRPQGTTPATAASSPWRVSATSGLTNLARVTMTATGLPPGPYFAGQCPAGQAPSIDACVRDHVVTVTDGTLTSTVLAFWWLRGGLFDCGSAPGTCVVGVMNATAGVVVASFPISFDPARHPTITVTPSDSLSDGQSVMVHGVDVGEGEVRIAECLREGEPSCTPAVKLASQPDGTFTREMPVHRVIDWFGRGGPESTTCGVRSDCVIEVWVIPPGLDPLSGDTRILINSEQPVGLGFAPAPPTTSTVPPITPESR